MEILQDPLTFTTLCSCTTVDESFLTQLSINHVITAEIRRNAIKTTDPTTQAAIVFEFLQKSGSNDDEDALLVALEKSHNKKALAVLRKQISKRDNKYTVDKISELERKLTEATREIAALRIEQENLTKSNAKQNDEIKGLKLQITSLQTHQDSCIMQEAKLQNRQHERPSEQLQRCCTEMTMPFSSPNEKPVTIDFLVETLRDDQYLLSSLDKLSSFLLQPNVAGEIIRKDDPKFIQLRKILCTYVSCDGHNATVERLRNVLFEMNFKYSAEKIAKIVHMRPDAM